MKVWITRDYDMIYGVYDSQEKAEKAMADRNGDWGSDIISEFEVK